MSADALTESVTSGKHMDFNKYEADLLDFERSFGFQNRSWPIQPQGDSVAISAAMLQKYTNTTQ